MGEARPDVAVVIVTCGSREDVERNLAELRAQVGVRLEIVVVDNGSADGTVELLEGQPDVCLIANGENRWLAPAWMQGVRATEAPYVLFLTPDTSLPEQDALARLKAALGADPGAALAGPRLFQEDGRDLLNGAFDFPSVPWVVLAALGLGGRLKLHERPKPRETAGETAPVRFVNGACMLVRRSALEAIGGLDERYRLYYEEIDLARRLQSAGRRVLLARSVRAVHRGKGSPAGPGLREGAYAHGERIYFRTHHGIAADLAVRAARAVERLRGRLTGRATGPLVPR